MRPGYFRRLYRRHHIAEAQARKWRDAEPADLLPFLARVNAFLAVPIGEPLPADISHDTQRERFTVDIPNRCYRITLRTGLHPLVTDPATPITSADVAKFEFQRA